MCWLVPISAEKAMHYDGLSCLRRITELALVASLAVIMNDPIQRIRPPSEAHAQGESVSPSRFPGFLENRQKDRMASLREVGELGNITPH